MGSGEVKLKITGKRLALFFTGVVCLSLLINVNFIRAQASAAEAKKLLEKGLALMEEANYEQANRYIEEASAIYINSENRVMAAHCYNHLSSNSRMMSKLAISQRLAEKALSLLDGMKLKDPTERIRAYTNLGINAAIGADYEQSLKLLNKASELIEDPAVSPVLKMIVISSLGYLYDDLGKYDQALYYYNQALDTLLAHPGSPKQRLAVIYNNIGVAYVNKGLYKKARHYYRLELDINLAVKGESHPDVAGTYLNLGASYYRSGDVGEALIYFKWASRVIAEAYGRRHAMMVIALNNIATCEMKLGNYQAAISYLTDAIDIKKQIVGANHPELAVTYQTIAKAYSEIGNEKKAHDYYRKALLIQKKNLRKFHPDLATTYNVLAVFLIENNRPRRALKYLKTARSILLNSVGGRHPKIADTFAATGMAYAQQGKVVQSISNFQKALAVTAPSFKGVKARENPKPAAVAYPAIAISVLNTKAEGLILLFEKQGDLQMLKASLYTYMALSKLLDKQQWGYNQLNSKVAIATQSYQIYERAIQAAYKMYEITGNRSYFQLIFYFSEKSKGRVLLEAVAHTNDKKIAGIPESLLQREHQLRNRLAQVKQSLFSITGSKIGHTLSVKRLKDSLFVLNRRIALFTRKLEEEYPKYHRLKYSSEFPSVYRIQKRLKEENAVILEYFYGRNSLYAIVITPQTIWVEPLKRMPTINDVTQFTRAIISDKEDYIELGYKLYSQLIKPIKSHLKLAGTVRIVPGGPLRLLPFESLLTQKVDFNEDLEFSGLPYFIQDYNISYSTSVALNVAMTNESKSTYDLQFVGFAPIFASEIKNSLNSVRSKNETGWETLSFSDYEVKTVASKFKKESSFWNFLSWNDEENTKLFLRSEATESNFKSNGLLNARYIHLATHAFATNQMEQQTGIIFYQYGNGKNDGILYASEIYNMKLQTQLVVLSACETGIGTIIPGEGIMGLSRAFRYAGADNLIVSLWKVGDRSTAELMISFYDNLKKGYSLPRALSAAKRMMIRNYRYAHPRYWSTFKLLGNGER